MRVLIFVLLAAISYAQTGYSVVNSMACSEPDNNQYTDMKACDGTTLTKTDYTSNDCTGTASETATWTNLATCTAQPDLVNYNDPMKVTISCDASANTATITLCGEDAINNCVITDDDDHHGCLPEMCSDLCCTTGTNNEAYLHAYWSKWSMRGNCQCGAESTLRTRKAEYDDNWLEETKLETCADATSTTTTTGNGNSSAYGFTALFTLAVIALAF